MKITSHLRVFIALSYHGAFTAICQSWGFFKDPRGMAAKLCRDCPLGINRLRPICKTERAPTGLRRHSNSHARVVRRWRKRLEATVSRSYRCTRCRELKDAL